jgi:hypothetical protein
MVPTRRRSVPRRNRNGGLAAIIATRLFDTLIAFAAGPRMPEPPRQAPMALCHFRNKIATPEIGVACESQVTKTICPAIPTFRPEPLLPVPLQAE